MDDGMFVKTGIRIATYNFTYEEHQRIIFILKIKFDLNCTIQTLNNRHCIYIKADSLNKIINLIDPYIIPSMKYKLGFGLKI
jgi:hypothetical protein